MGESKGTSRPVSCLPVVGVLEKQKGKVVKKGVLSNKHGPSSRNTPRSLGLSKFLSSITAFDSSSLTCSLRICLIPFDT